VRVLKADATSNFVGRFNPHAEQLCISSIVLAELHVGAENAQRVAENLIGIEHFVARLSAVLDFDPAAAADFGGIRVALRTAPIGSLDTLIAAHARSQDLIVVTGNVGSFVGWSLGGHAVVLVGSVCGLALGAWLDISSSRIATLSRWPVAVGALVILAVAIFR
jgi:tRNA(fMet)-specific endonuclease VapC